MNLFVLHSLSQSLTHSVSHSVTNKFFVRSISCKITFRELTLLHTKCLYAANLLYKPVCPSLSHSLSQSVTKIFLSSLYHPIKRSENLFDFIQNVCMLQSSSMNMFVFHSITRSVSQSITIFLSSLYFAQ